MKKMLEFLRSMGKKLVAGIVSVAVIVLIFAARFGPDARVIVKNADNEVRSAENWRARIAEKIPEMDAETALEAIEKARTAGEWIPPIWEHLKPDVFLEIDATTHVDEEEYVRQTDVFALVGSRYRISMKMTLNGAAVHDDTTEKSDSETAKPDAYTKLSLSPDGNGLRARFELKVEAANEPIYAEGQLELLNGATAEEVQRGAPFTAQLESGFAARLDQAIVEISKKSLQQKLSAYLKGSLISAKVLAASPVIVAYVDGKLLVSRPQEQRGRIVVYGWRNSAAPAGVANDPPSIPGPAWDAAKAAAQAAEDAAAAAQGDVSVEQNPAEAATPGGSIPEGQLGAQDATAEDPAESGARDAAAAAVEAARGVALPPSGADSGQDMNGIETQPGGDATIPLGATEHPDGVIPPPENER